MHSIEHCIFIIVILFSIDFQTVLLGPNNVLKIFSNFQKNCTTSKIFPQREAYKSLVFNKETALSTWGIYSECRSIFTYCINSLVFISIPSDVNAYLTEIPFVVFTDFRKPYCALDYRVF